MKADIVGPDGHHYSRTGILQPLLMAPFFAAGHAVDETIGHFNEYPNGYTFLWFYNPFVAALAAVALFALVYQARRSLKWATTIAALFTVASIAWPYSKIGMETTFMAAVMVAFAVAYWARNSPSLLSWGLTGFATGAAVATKAYSLVAVLPIAILLWPAFAGARPPREAAAGGRGLPAGAALDRRDRLVQLVALRRRDRASATPNRR